MPDPSLGPPSTGPSASYSAARPNAQASSQGRLTERMVEEGFHYVLKEALIQAQAEGLLDADVGQWSPAELQITAAALSLYFAALQARGSPPCITAPRPIESGMGSEQQAFVLSSENCPPSFASFFALWQVCVPRVQRLDLERRHDLALILCDQPPQSSPVHMEVAALARDIKVVALDIVQRQTFQSRFQEDVETAIAASIRTSSPHGRYDAPPSEPPAASDPPPEFSEKALPTPPQHNDQASAPALPPKRNSLGGHRPLPRPPVPTIAVEPPAEEDETLIRIRETLFAALGDCIATNLDLAGLLRNHEGDKEWTSRAYFASLCLAILDVSLGRTYLPDILALPGVSDDAQQDAQQTDLLHAGHPSREQELAWQQSYVRTVNLGSHLGGGSQDGSRSSTDRHDEQHISLQACPASHAKLLMALLNVARNTQRLARTDDERAIDDVQHDRPTDESAMLLPALKRCLLGDVVPPAVDGHSSQGPPALSPTAEGCVRETGNMINRLALAIFEIPSFRQRQAEVFQVLRAITSV